MRKFIIFIGISLGSLILIGIILVLYSQYKILNRGKEVAEEFIKSEQKRQNIKCSTLEIEFKNFIKNELLHIIQNESLLRGGEDGLEARDLVKKFNDKLSTCSLLYVYDKQYKIGETGNLEYISNVEKEYSIIYTLITYPESDSTCNEYCRKKKKAILEQSYKNLDNLLKA